MVQAGLLTQKQVAVGSVLSFGLAILLGLYLVKVGGWPILAIGVAAVVSGIAYTGGPWPLGYHGLGDVFVFIFFGVIAVAGTFYLQAGSVTGAALLASFPVAMLVTAILVVNNLRDVDTDRKAGKRTLAVRLGREATQIQYTVLVLGAYFITSLMWLAGAATAWAMLTLADDSARYRAGSRRLAGSGRGAQPRSAANRGVASLLWNPARRGLDPVKIRRLTWRPYRIPFRQTFLTSAASQTVRTGVIVRLEGEGGLYGLGEIAPLRKGAERNVASLLGFLEPRLAGIQVDEIPKAAQRLAGNSVAAAIRCGLDIAACDLLARAAGVPVAEFLGGRRRRLVPVNATISRTRRNWPRRRPAARWRTAFDASSSRLE